jgi:hypothetical protein
VTSLGMNPFFWVAVGLAVWVLWRMLRRRGGRGHLSLRSRRGTAGTFGPFGTAMAQFYSPGVRHVLEEQREVESRRDDEDEGEPPTGGPSPHPDTDQPGRDSSSSHRS